MGELKKHGIRLSDYVSTLNLWDTLKCRRFGSKKSRRKTEYDWASERTAWLIRFLREISKVPDLLNHDAFKTFLGYDETQPIIISYTHHLDYSINRTYSPDPRLADYTRQNPLRGPKMLQRKLIKVELPNKAMEPVFCYDANAEKHLPEAINKDFFDKLVVTHYAGTASSRLKLFYHYETWLKCLHSETGDIWLVNLNFPDTIFQINVMKGDDPEFMGAPYQTGYQKIGQYAVIAPLKGMLDEKWRTVSSGVNVWDLLTEFSETRYSFLPPAIWGWSKEKNNCQSTHYRVVQKCLGKLNTNLDHMIFKVTRAITDATKKTYTD